MLIAVPLAAFLTLFWCLRRIGAGLRDGFVWAALVWAIWLTLLTESLGLFRDLTGVTVATGWLAFGIASTLFLLRKRPGAKPRAPIAWQDILMLAGIGFLSGVVLLTAVLSPPNTWDAMDYHMPRIAMWASNHSVSFFPTPYTQQLFLAPWAEYAMLHLYLTAGGDRFVNLVEWFSMLGCSVAASLIARELGAGKRGQILAALVSLTIPQGLLEASGAMNCYVVSFWLAVMFYFVLRSGKDPSWLNLLSIGGALGLALLSKGMTYIFAPPLLAAGVWMCAPAKRRVLVLRFVAAGALALALNGPLYIRNVRLSGSPLGFSAPGGNPRQAFANARISVGGTASNVLRNITLHLGAPVSGVNKITERMTAQAIRWIGSIPDDPETTRTAFQVNPMSRAEVKAGNPLHILLLIAFLLYLLVSREACHDTAIAAGALIAAFLLYCALLRWDIWSSRYQLPLFVIGSALVGVMFAGRAKGAAAVAVLLFTAALPFAFSNTLRPLVSSSGTVFSMSRTAQYFADMHGDQESSFVAATDAVQRQGCRTIGLDSSLYRFEYPMLALLGAGITTHVRYTSVINGTEAYEHPADSPDCAVVCLGCARSPSKWAAYRAVGGHVSVFDDVAVFSASGDLANRDVPAGLWPDPRQEAARFASVMEQSMAAISHTDLGPTEQAVRQVAQLRPNERRNLRSRLDSLYALRFHATQTYDAAIVVLSKGRFDSVEQNYIQAAAESIGGAQTDLREKPQALKRSAREMLSH